MSEPVAHAEGGVLVRVLIVPGASRPGVVGLHADRVRVRVAAPPEAGKANRALEALLAGVLGVRSRAVEVVSGHASREKTVLVRGVSPDDARRLLS